MLDEFESIAKKIQADFDRSSRLSHPGIKGSIREDSLVEQLLSLYIPQKYSIGKGLICDVDGSFSKQQDIVVYDGFHQPVFQDFRENKIFFAEQVLLVIEAKSILAYKEINDIIDKAKSVISLRRVGDAGKSRIFVFGFCYRSKLSIDQIRDYAQSNQREDKEGWGISAIAVIADKDGKTGLISNVDKHALGAIKVDATEKDPVASIESASVGQTLFIFYMLLMEAIKLTEAKIVPPNYLAYASNAGLGTVNIKIGEQGVQELPYQKAIEVLKNANDLPDDKVVKAWHFLVKHAEEHDQSAIPNKGAFFTIGEVRILEGPEPYEVWESTERFIRGSATDEDRAKLNFLIGILRKAVKENTYLGWS